MTNLILLRVPEAASYIGLSTSTLAKMRLRGDGPPYREARRPHHSKNELAGVCA
jgi:hypothetical protein